MNEFSSYPQDEYDYPVAKCDWVTIITIVSWLTVVAEVAWCNFH